MTSEHMCPETVRNLRDGRRVPRKEQRQIKSLAPQALKARKINLVHNVTIADGLREMAVNALSQLKGNLPALSAVDNAEGLHQARVAIERLRSVLRLFEKYLEPGMARGFNLDLKGFGRIFGAARDWDVFVLETIPCAARAGIGDQSLDVVRKSAGYGRRTSHRAVQQLIVTPKFTDFILNFSNWVENIQWRSVKKDDGKYSSKSSKPLRRFSSGMLEHLEARVNRRGHNIDACTADELHATRKAVKNLRDGIEYLSSLYSGKSVRVYCDACEDVQTFLGEINDMIVAHDLVERLRKRDSLYRTVEFHLFTQWTDRQRDACLKRLPKVWAGFQDRASFWS